MTEVEEAAEALVAARRVFTAASRRAEQVVAARVHAEVGQALADRDRAEDDHRAAVDQLRAALEARSKPGVASTHGNRNCYARGCRCEPCRDAARQYMRELRRSGRYKQERMCTECGAAYPSFKYSASVLCPSCRSRRGRAAQSGRVAAEATR